MRGFTIILLIVFTSTLSVAQKKYWIYFQSKESCQNNHDYVSYLTIQNRKGLHLETNQLSDMPINDAYLKIIESQLDIPVINQSRWLNAITVRMDYVQVQKVKGLPFVREVVPVRTNSYLASDKVSYDNFALEQLNVQAFEKNGYTGKGVTIGVIDGDFNGVANYPYLKHVFTNTQNYLARDFTQKPVQEMSAALSDRQSSHGANVVQFISGFDGSTGRRYGVAPNAKMVLAKTDVTDKEFRGEEDYWIAALEWMDSLGVRLINSSIGYSEGYDDPKQNYTPLEMNGQTSAIAKAASIATKEKGMILVLAAGNEGANIRWQVLTTPADASGVITVGATDIYGLKRKSSSVGPAFLKEIKPDVACYSSSGTSYSAPVITGLIACLLEATPSITNTEIIKALHRTGSLSGNPNNYLGYGIPDVNKLLEEIKKPSGNVISSGDVVKQSGELYVQKIDKGLYPNAVIFHKLNAYTVKNQEYIDIIGDELRINKPLKVMQSTVVIKGKVFEIIWE